MIIAGCQDSSVLVQEEAIESAKIYIDRIANKEIVMEMKPVIGAILTTLGICLQRGDEDVVVEGLDIFETISDMEYPLINDHVEVSPSIILKLSTDLTNRLNS